jgi:hypothetical protein
MGWLRHPRTTQERRANQDWKWCRPCRRPHLLPTTWDDLWNKSKQDRSWKRHRDNQYHVRPIKEYDATQDCGGFHQMDAIDGV